MDGSNLKLLLVSTSAIVLIVLAPLALA